MNRRRVTKAEWSRRGGLSCLACIRLADKRGRWRYYILTGV